MCAILGSIFYEVYNKEFEYDDPNKRIMLQGMVYLLENMGLNIGDYSFSWDKHGPYSLRLDGDSKYCIDGSEKEKVIFSERASKCFGKLREVIQKNNTGCEIEDWVEYVASVHYLYHVKHIGENKVFGKISITKECFNTVDKVVKEMGFFKV